MIDPRSGAVPFQVPASSRKPSRMFVHTPVDHADELEESLEAKYLFVSSRIADMSDKMIHDTLISLASQIYNDQVCLGLMYGILISPNGHPNAQKWYTNLYLVSRDGMRLVIAMLDQICMLKYTKLTDVSRYQLLWLVTEIVRSDVPQIDNLFNSLLRNIVGGDLSKNNCWLAEFIIDLLIDQKMWLYRNSNLICPVVFTYVRLIVDHEPVASLQSLRNKEIKFCISALREKFDACVIGGRDLIRLIIQVGKIPQFEELLNDLIHNPASISPNIQPTILQRMLFTRPPKRLLIGRLTPDMEKKIFFLLQQVKFANRKRYFDWLQGQYLSTLPSQTLRSDLIRYICAVVHPSNEVLGSDIAPRWSVINWLLQIPPSGVTTYNPVINSFNKLALFLDWFFYDAERDSIMLIEPGALLLHHICKTPLCLSLIDFLCRSINEFGVAVPGLKEKMKMCVQSSMQQILEKRVLTLSSVQNIFDQPRIDRDLRSLMMEHFSEYSSPEVSVKLAPAVLVEGVAEPGLMSDKDGDVIFMSGSDEGDLMVIDEDGGGDSDAGGLDLPSFNQAGRMGGAASQTAERRATFEDAEFSDEDGEDNNGELASSNELSPLDVIMVGTGGPNARLPATNNARGMNQKPIRPGSIGQGQQRGGATTGSLFGELTGGRPVDLSAVGLPPHFGQAIRELKAAGHQYAQCDAIQKLMMALLAEEDIDDRQVSAVATILSEFLTDELLAKSVLPTDVTSVEQMEDSLRTPLGTMLRNYCISPERDPAYSSLQSLLTHLYKKRPRIGYHLLYVLKATSFLKEDVRYSLYPDLCKAADDEVSECLVRDLDLCQDDDYKMFGYLLPTVYLKYGTIAVQSVALLRLVVSSIDGIQLHDLMTKIIQGNITMFRRDSFMNVLTASLAWETIEQYFLWQLIAVDDIHADWIIHSSFITQLQYPEHSEAMSSILLFLKRSDVAPTTALVRNLLNRAISKHDFFTSSTLKILFDNDEDKLVEVLSSQIGKAIICETHTQKQIQKRMISSRTPPLDQLLGHLDIFRRHCSTFQNMLEKHSLRSALKDAQKNCGDFLKAKYSELFSVLELLQAARGGRSLRGGRKLEQNADESDSSDEEENKSSKPAAKKRKKLVDSDSD